MKKFIALSLVSLCILFAQAQDLQSYTRIVKKLSSAKYQGRGYAQNGVVKAGNYLAQEFQKAGADTVFKQPFTQDINTYPGNMTMLVDDRKLSAGEDFVMREYSPGAHGTFKLYFVDTLHYDIERIIADLNKPENKDAMIVCDFWFPYKHGGDFRRLEGSETGNAGFIYTWTTPLKFYKAYGQRVVEKPVIWTTAAAMEGAKNVTLDIDHQFMADYESSNIVARVQGRRHDSCFVFTAHYDHLGNLGRDIYCPGVNDNASGTAAIVTLAAYYAQHQPEFDIWFVAFAGEETGLRGSTHFVKNPVMPLSQIKYLFNLDMIGDNNPVQYCEVSEQGMDGFHQLERINAEQHLFKELELGELAENSDHYPFAAAGVPCILFEQEEGDFFQYYHTQKDDMDHFCTVTYPLIFKLVTSYVAESKSTIFVDFNEGVELMALVWRLMGEDNVFIHNLVPNYTRSADQYFAPYKNHPVVDMARKHYKKNYINKGKVVDFGMHLVISSEGKITFNQQFKAKSDFVFELWPHSLRKKILPLLEDFYKQSNFHQWYVSTDTIREAAKRAFAPVIQKINTKWYNDFFGVASEKTHFQVVLSLLTSIKNFGLSSDLVNEEKMLFPVISSCFTNEDGLLYYNPSVFFPIIVHEFCHPFCNPLIERNWHAMNKTAYKVYRLNKEKLEWQSYYNPISMVSETFVRSCVIRYLSEHEQKTKDTSLIKQEMLNGFLLTDNFVKALDTYEKQRDNYPSMKEFMPEIVKSVNSFDTEKFLLDREAEKLFNATYTCNIQDGATDIPSGDFYLVITFSKPIDVESFELFWGDSHCTGEFPTLARGTDIIHWNESQTVCSFALDLKPHTKYSFAIYGDRYKTMDGHTAGDRSYINFTTGD